MGSEMCIRDRNTPAAKMASAVPMEERRRRNKMLRILSEKKKQAFYESHLHQVREVLVEGRDEQGFYTGFTDNYIKIKSNDQALVTNRLIDLELDQLNFQVSREQKLGPIMVQAKRPNLR